MIIFYFLKNFGRYLFLGLCLVKNVIFGQFWQKPNFAPIIASNIQKWFQIQLRIVFLCIFCSFVLNTGAKLGFCQNWPKMDIFHYTKSQKSIITKVFQEIENAHNVWFSHRFSILDQKVTPKGLLDAYGQPLAFGLA